MSFVLDIEIIFLNLLSICSKARSFLLNADKLKNKKTSSFKMDIFAVPISSIPPMVTPKLSIETIVEMHETCDKDREKKDTTDVQDETVDVSHEHDAREDDAHEDDAHEDDTHEDDAHEDDAHEDDAHEDDAHEDDAHEDDAHEDETVDDAHNEECSDNNDTEKDDDAETSVASSANNDSDLYIDMKESNESQLDIQIKTIMDANTLKELRKLCKTNGLPTQGNKKELATRYLNKHDEIVICD